jgi:hypothetical protein
MAKGGAAALRTVIMSTYAMRYLSRLTPIIVTLMLGACTTLPTGPSMLVMPGSGKSFDQFRGDDAMCRQYALDQIGGTTPNQAAVNSGVSSAAVGTVLGAAAGAAIDGGHGAAVGAGTGMVFGGLAGTGAGQASAYGAQRSYDNAYIQCMYAQGHRVPVSGRVIERRSTYQTLPPPPGMSPPPPPPYGAPPPPPPGVQ